SPWDARLSDVETGSMPFVHSYASVVETFSTRFRPDMDGERRAASIKSDVAFVPLEMTPRMAPRSRRWRTNLRVSTSAMTGMLYFARKCSARSSDRQLLATGEISRTTRPSIYGECASLSAAFAP